MQCRAVQRSTGQRRAVLARSPHLAQGLAINLLRHALVVEGAPAGGGRKHGGVKTPNMPRNEGQVLMVYMLGQQGRQACPRRKSGAPRGLPPLCSRRLLHSQLGVILNLQLLLAASAGKRDVELQKRKAEHSRQARQDCGRQPPCQRRLAAGSAPLGGGAQASAAF